MPLTSLARQTRLHIHYQPHNMIRQISPINLSLSRIVARCIQATTHNCYRNAHLATRLLNAHYLEGWALPPHGQPVEHGWLEWRNQLIDPTFIGWGYFPTYRFNLIELNQVLDRTQRQLPWHWFNSTQANQHQTNYQAALTQHNRYRV